MQSTSQTNRRFSRRIWILMGVMVLLAAGVILVVRLLGGGGSGTLIDKWQSAEGDLLQLNEDGTYWRSGQVSQDGRYSTSTTAYEIGDDGFMRAYDIIRFVPNDFSLSDTIYHYRLNGSRLDICLYVSRSTGNFDEATTIHYRRR